MTAYRCTLVTYNLTWTYAQVLLTLERAIQIVITSNELLYVTKIAIDGRGLQKW